MSNKAKAEVITILLGLVPLLLILVLGAQPWFVVFLFVFCLISGFIMFMILGMFVYDKLFNFVLGKIESKDDR